MKIQRVKSLENSTWSGVGKQNESIKAKKVYYMRI